MRNKVIYSNTNGKIDICKKLNSLFLLLMATLKREIGVWFVADLQYDVC